MTSSIGTMGRRRLMLGGAAGIVSVAAERVAAKPLVAADDKRLTTQAVIVPGMSGPLAAYYARPAGNRRKPASVLLVHESRGLNPYIEDVTRRLALSGYATLAPDFLSPRGGTPEDADEAKARHDALDTDQVVADAVAAVAWQLGRDDLSGKVAAIGFAWGGNIVGRLAVVAPVLKGGVVFYGKPPAAKDAPAIRVPLLMHVAEADDKNTDAIEPFITALTAAGRPPQVISYAGATQSFHNDGVASRFDAAAAQKAWDATLKFLAACLA